MAAPPAIAAPTFRAAPLQHAGTAERRALRLSASLLLGGALLTVVAGAFHPDREPANQHAAVFAEYAASSSWTLVHLGQFAAMGVTIAGLLTLFVALRLRGGAAGWVARLAAGAAGATFGLYGVLQAVDGVALKQAVDAWARAPQAEQASRFATAEAVRWLEWGVRSYESFVFGLTLVLFGAAIAATARLPRPIGYVMGLSGLAYAAQGWVVGAEGFSSDNAAPTLLAYAFTLIWTVALVVVSWRMPESTGSAAE